MEIPKPVALATVAILLVLALAAVWFFAGRSGGAGNTVPQSVYPKASEGPGVEAYGIQPPDNRAMPAQALPLEGRGKR